MPIQQLMNTRVNVYTKADDGVDVEEWFIRLLNVDCRIMPLTAADLAVELTSITQSPTDAAYFVYTSDAISWVVGGAALKVVARLDTARGWWVGVDDGDEYLIVSRPRDASGQHHHLKAMLAWFEAGRLV